MSGPARPHTRAWVAHAEERYTHVRERFDRTTAGAVHRRITEVDVTKKALILSALALMLFIPALVSLVAILPVGSNDGVASGFARRLGLSAEATADVQKLFGTRQTVHGSTTVFSALVTIVLAYGWPAELRRGYEYIWQLPAQSVREIWRPLAWLGVFVAIVGGTAAIGSASSGGIKLVVYVLVILPLLCLWVWWSVHLLLGGRVAWRALIPTAIITGCALAGFRAYTLVSLSPNITSNFDRYGPIGVVFALLSWMIGFAVVMLGGPLVGEIVHQRRRRRDGGAEGQS